MYGLQPGTVQKQLSLGVLESSHLTLMIIVMLFSNIPTRLYLLFYSAETLYLLFE